MLHWIQIHQLALVTTACFIGAVLGFWDGFRHSGSKGLGGKFYEGLLFGLVYGWTPAAVVTIVAMGIKAVHH